MLTDIALGQYYPGNSLIHKLDPRTKILITLFFIVAIFLASGAVSYGILWGFVFLIILLSRLPLMLVLKSIKPLWIIIVLTMVIHMFTGQGENVIFSCWTIFGKLFLTDITPNKKSTQNSQKFLIDRV